MAGDAFETPTAIESPVSARFSRHFGNSRRLRVGTVHPSAFLKGKLFRQVVPPSCRGMAHIVPSDGEKPITLDLREVSLVNLDEGQRCAA